MSSGKKQRETSLWPLIQNRSRCSAFDNTKLFSSFPGEGLLYLRNWKRYPKRSELSMEWNEVGEAGGANQAKHYRLR